MTTTWRIIVILGTIVSLAVIGSLGYALFTTELEKQTALGYATYLNDRTRSAGDVLRGTVESIDANTIVIRVANPYGPGTYTLRTLTDGSTTVAKEEVRVENGVIVGIASSTPATLDDLTPSARVAFLVIWNDGQLLLRYVLFGNPL